MTPSEKVTAREAQRLATRERLFAAAVAEFKRSGVAGADVGAIVAEAGVAHGTFFFHFPTRQHALAELGHREEVRMAGELDRFLATAPDLRATLHEVLRMTASLERRLGRALFKELLGLYFAPTRPELQLWRDHPPIARVIAEFEAARERGEIGADLAVDPANAALFFLMGSSRCSSPTSAGPSATACSNRTSPSCSGAWRSSDPSDRYPTEVPPCSKRSCASASPGPSALSSSCSGTT